ncbi:hypothetical protein BGY98DRAFT_936387 [Russula aff. rugulosa BPL654]|nr:hypothetical protein BGY98DRAFT_936387 [Russula aff. rugulosa BPL654]
MSIIILLQQIYNFYNKSNITFTATNVYYYGYNFYSKYNFTTIYIIMDITFTASTTFTAIVYYLDITFTAKIQLLQQMCVISKNGKGFLKTKNRTIGLILDLKVSEP